MARIVTKKGFLTFIKILVVLGLIGWGLLSWFAPTAHVRYELEVTLEVDGEPVTGSVVQEMTIAAFPFDLLPGPRTGRKVRGQALALDLPGRGTLFVTMALYCPGKTEWGQCKYGYAYLIDVACGIKREEGFAAYVRRFKRLSGSCPLTADQLPVMVRFEDEDDQASAHIVRPEQLAATFGGDVRFVNASIAFTGAPLSTGLDTRLRWLAEEPPHSYAPFILNPDGTRRPYFPYGSFRRF